MSRPPQGPRLILDQPKGYSQQYWFITWHEGYTRTRSTGAREGEREKADRKLEDFIASRRRREGPCHPDQIAVGDVLTLYMEEHAPHTADPARIGHCVAALVDFWGNMPVSAIKRETCRKYARQRTRAQGTIRRELGCLAAALEYARGEGTLIYAPKVTLPPKPAPKDNWFTVSQMAAIIRGARVERKARHHLPLFILCALYLGQRRTAILELQWSECTRGGWVDLEREMIYWIPTGTRKRKPRAQPIPRRLLRFLKYARTRTTRYVIEANGKPVKAVKRSWATACRNAGMDGRLHDLRHTSISWMIQRGLSIEETADFVGISAEMVRRVYRHHAPDFQERARRALD